MDVATDTLSHLNADELREMVQSLRQTVSFKQATIDKLTHENALLKRLKFAAQSERFSAEQRSLLEETLDEDTQAVHDEMAELNTEPIPARVKDQPKRQPLPANLPRIDIRHEPDSTTCRCGCQMQRIGEDVAEKPSAWEMGLRPVRDPGAGARGGARHRQRHPDYRAIGAGAGGQVRRPLAAVPPGGHLWPCRIGHSSLDAGRLGGQLWGATPAAGGRLESRHPEAPRGARR